MGIDIVTWKESMVFALLGRSLAEIQTLHHAYLVDGSIYWDAQFLCLMHAALSRHLMSMRLEQKDYLELESICSILQTRFKILEGVPYKSKFQQIQTLGIYYGIVQ